MWFIAGDAQLDPYARQLIEEPGNERYLSVASLWEIPIKSGLGKLVVPVPPSVLIRDHVWANAIELLAIAPEHLDVLQGLVYHHKDPFDHLMIAQATHEDLIIITNDQAFSAYKVRVEWAKKFEATE